MNKIYHSWEQVDRWCNRIALDILKTDWRPDYIVGLTRGGLVPAVRISHLLDIPMHTLKVQLRDGNQERRLKIANQVIGVLPRILRHLRHIERQLSIPKRCPDCGYYPGQRPSIDPNPVESEER